ncbi:MAG TPA: hypothetical protein EYG86_01350 [Crocinitomicaceae bacterium]|nr:hypothetical protein [Crocinitomicaceae bacterium]
MAGLKFRVLLDSKSKNKVFRDILISDSDNFESFYKAILTAYNFSQDQMASFYMSNHNWDKGFEISLFDMSFGEDDSQILPGIMSECTIREYIQDPDQKMILVHDFLRMWMFLVELIGIEKEEPNEAKLILTVGEAPAEDSKSQENEDLQFETESEMGDEEDDEFDFGEYDDY